MSRVAWKQFTDLCKRKPIALQLAAQLGRGRGHFRWLDQINPPQPAPLIPDLKDWENRDLSAVWIGHATVLLRLEGMTILTDPVMANRVGLGYWLGTLGPRRHAAPALKIRQLPPIDLLLISHAHFDHLDRQSLWQLPKKMPVIAASNTLDLIRDLGFKDTTELRWGEKTRLRNLTITAREVSHWGARTFIDKHRGYNAYLIESTRRKMLYGGDTAYHTRFQDLNKIDLAIFGIGAYDPYIAAHATPEQAWEMANHARATHILPMHHSTFRLSHEPMEEPMQRMLEAAGRDTDRIIIRQIGQTWTAN
jgi:L-ascorbate metabolism protein UlaG (beta-lactamase superfamily)